jgi:cyclophilin family peptidyl-prolyl cis-trans isomerase
MTPMKPTRRLLASFLLAALAGVPLGAAAQAKPNSEAAKPASCTANLKGSAPMKVKLTTSMGAITIELNKEKAPISAENFAKYVEAGHYNGTIFHRVIDGFMIQGGGFSKDMKERPAQAPIKNEAANGLKNDAYTLAMARTGVRDSATAQFFINVKTNDFLNYRDESPQGWGYAVFGKVTEGQDVVDKIRKVATGNAGMHQNVPRDDVVLTRAEETKAA